MSSSAPTPKPNSSAAGQQQSLPPNLRKLLIAILFACTSIVQHGSIEYDFSSLLLTSGVGLVTTDGMWGEDDHGKYKDEDIKILGFTNKRYLPLARVWYNRMTVLGYNEHWIVAHDDISYDSLRGDEYRVIPCIIKNPEYRRPVQGIWQQIMSARLHFTRDLLKNGTHLLITDVDNVYSRYVPLYGFLEEGYDVYHAHEMRYPTDIFNEFGWVVCSGQQFLRSSPNTLRFMDLMMEHCPGEKCDDQVTYNNVFFHHLEVKWYGITNPNHKGALRVNSTHPENNNLLVESVTGRSKVTNHTIKIWDRDFAWRLAGGYNDTDGAIPKYCPSTNNWVGMPTKLPESLTGTGLNKTGKKIALFKVWDKHCLNERMESG